MPSLIDYRRRIRSVKNTQQITKAMKMVSAAKLRRAQESVVAARPFAAMLRGVLANVAGAAAGNESVAENPLLIERAEKKALIILVTADRGLAGAFNSNLNRATQKFIADQPAVNFAIEAIGKKGRDYFRRRGITIAGEHASFSRKPTYHAVAAIATDIAKRYANADFDAVYLVFNEFRSVISQKVSISRILPVPLPAGESTQDYIYEQPPAELLATLLPRYVENELWRAVLESTASEHAARMTAMDSASRNAADVIERVTLEMNRVRQASITREIIEVVSGASALE